jgi:hypothetical protein
MDAVSGDGVNGLAFAAAVALARICAAAMLALDARSSSGASLD